MADTAKQQPLFRNPNEDLENNEEPELTEIESLCMQCFQQGVTRLLLTKIPFFKEVVVSSFQCNSCGWQNNELQPASRIQDRGIRYKVKCKNQRDLSRQLIKTEWAEITIPEIEFEIKKQTGLITTIEGILGRAIDGLNQTVKALTEQNQLESLGKVVDFISKLQELKSNEKEFTLIVDDPTGNSFVENPFASKPDPEMEVKHYLRSVEQNRILGIVPDIHCGGDPEYDPEKDPRLNQEVLQFPTNCPECNAPCFTNMKVTEIPHFKEVVIMATNCEACGHKTNEIKSGTGIEPQGIRITTKIKNENDLKKDLVKSDTCSVIIPEIELEVGGSGFGRYTTIEGLIEYLKEQLTQTNPFIAGDSARPEVREKLDRLVKRMSNLVGLTIILDDPTGNSFVQDADEVTHYERTYEQNEELGLNDMKVENYEEDAQ